MEKFGENLVGMGVYFKPNHEDGLWFFVTEFLKTSNLIVGFKWLKNENRWDENKTAYPEGFIEDATPDHPMPTFVPENNFNQRIAKPFMFSFDFELSEGYETTDDDDKFVISGFTITEQGIKNLLTKYNLPDFSYFPEEYEYDFVQNIESDYGVHDFGCSQVDEVFRAGYHSYEIHEDKIDELMNKWREFYVGFCGDDNVSKVAKFEFTPEEFNEYCEQSYLDNFILFNKIIKHNSNI